MGPPPPTLGATTRVLGVFRRGIRACAALGRVLVHALRPALAPPRRSPWVRALAGAPSVRFFSPSTLSERSASTFAVPRPRGPTLGVSLPGSPRVVRHVQGSLALLAPRPVPCRACFVPAAPLGFSPFRGLFALLAGHLSVGLALLSLGRKLSPVGVVHRSAPFPRVIAGFRSVPRSVAGCGRSGVRVAPCPEEAVNSG